MNKLDLDKVVKFTLNIGYAGATREEEFTLRKLSFSENDNYNEYELKEILNQEWQEWSNNFVDGGFRFEDEE